MRSFQQNATFLKKIVETGFKFIGENFSNVIILCYVIILLLYVIYLDTGNFANTKYVSYKLQRWILRLDITVYLISEDI